MAEKTVGDMSEWSGMLKDLFRQIGDGSIRKENFQAFLEHRSPFSSEEVSRFLLLEWEKFYQDVFKISVDLSNVKIPEKRIGFDRLIVVAQGMSPQKLFNKCKELFPCQISRMYADSDLDKIIHSKRTAQNGAYAVWFRNTVEADEVFKSMDTCDLERKGIQSITLEERFLMELKYFIETGRHLDIKNMTLCASSPYPNGDFPEISWHSGKENFLDIGWCTYRASFKYLRARQAIL